MTEIGERRSAPPAVRLPDEVARWSAGLPEEFLMCRDLGHTWRPASARWLPDENAYERVMRCGRCHAEREQLLSPGGMILSGHYTYESGYQAPKGSGVIDAQGRGALRIETITRLLGHDRGSATKDEG